MLVSMLGQLVHTAWTASPSSAGSGLSLCGTRLWVGPMRTLLLSVTLLWCLADVSSGYVLGCFGRSDVCQQYALRGGVCLSLYGVPSDDVITGISGRSLTETSAEELLRQHQSGRQVVGPPK
jgi:hypothetical protein